MTDTARYFAQIAYNGSLFCGWQVQPKDPSVQGALNEALSLLTNEDINVVGAGRTDTGVHASFYILHFETKTTRTPDELKRRLNSMLPKSIRVDRVCGVPLHWHARFDATARTYRYWVNLNKDPFLYQLTTYLHREPNFDLMNEAAERLLHYADFTSFSKLHTQVKTNICRVNSAAWHPHPQKEGLFYFEIKADRFLRNMVRSIVGTLLDVGYGRRKVSDFIEIIEAKDRCKAGASAQAQGLYLADIAYPEGYDIEQNRTLEF